MKLELIWNMADIANAFMAVPNLMGLLGLSGVVIAQTESYNRKPRIARKLHKKKWW
jgi:AGCS family alanine or glycine:cation symporter